MRLEAGARRRRAVLLALSLACTAGSNVACGSDRDPLLATFQDWRGEAGTGEVRLSDYSDWMVGRSGSEETPLSPLERIELMLVVQVLADRAAAAAPSADAARRLRDAEERILVAALEARVMADTRRDLEAASLADPGPELGAEAQLRELRVRVAEGASDDERSAARDRIETLHAALVGGADFGELARAESDADSRQDGGLRDWTPLEELPPVVQEAVRDLDPGQLAPVLEDEEGFLLVALEDGRAEVQVRTRARRARDRAARQAGRQAWEALAAELRENADTAVDLEAGPEPGAVVLHFRDEAVTRGELDTWRGPLALIRPLTAADAERFVVQRIGSERARADGLAAEPEVASALRWRRLEVLAASERRRHNYSRIGAITEIELRARYEARSERWVEPGRVRLEGIRLRRTTPEEVEALRSRLAAGEIPFAEAARKHSADPSAERGGDLGWLQESQLRRFGAEGPGVVANLEPGSVSEPIKGQWGYWIVRLNEREPARPRGFEEVREQLEREVRGERLRIAARSLDEELREMLQVELAPEAEEHVPPDPEPEAGRSGRPSARVQGAPGASGLR
jgi:parvulin-like peptidyl-prolyl isomerase